LFDLLVDLSLLARFFSLGSVLGPDLSFHIRTLSSLIVVLVVFPCPVSLHLGDLPHRLFPQRVNLDVGFIRGHSSSEIL
jgi:hypothetical protein